MRLQVAAICQAERRDSAKTSRNSALKDFFAPSGAPARMHWLVLDSDNSAGGFCPQWRRGSPYFKGRNLAKFCTLPAQRHGVARTKGQLSRLWC